MKHRKNFCYFKIFVGNQSLFLYYLIPSNFPNKRDSIRKRVTFRYSLIITKKLNELFISSLAKQDDETTKLQVCVEKSLTSPCSSDNNLENICFLVKTNTLLFIIIMQAHAVIIQTDLSIIATRY